MGSSVVDFATLLVDARAGGRDALAALYRTYQPPLGRYLRVCVGAAADDLASDVWLAIATGLHRFDGDERGFRAWLFTIARRRVIDMRRQASRRRTDPVDHERFATLSGVEDPEAAAVEHLSTSEAIALVARNLPPEQAEVVLLRVVGDLSVGEVARITGRTETNVRVTQHRALARLERRLSSRVVAQ
jgi:RNA polymerase sigma-70 factor (ECF subfamily)